MTDPSPKSGLLLSILSLALNTWACSGEGEARLRERTSSRGEASRAQAPAPADLPPADLPPADPPPAAPSAEAAASAELPPIDRAAAAARVLDETVTEALAAAHAAEVGASTCDAAYESAAELVRVVRERFPDEVHDMPPRELFVSHCQQLPAPAQQCLVVRYAVAHEAECRRVQQSLPEGQRRQMEQLLRGQ